MQFAWQTTVTSCVAPYGSTGSRGRRPQTPTSSCGAGTPLLPPGPSLSPRRRCSRSSRRKVSRSTKRLTKRGAGISPDPSVAPVAYLQILQGLYLLSSRLFYLLRGCFNFKLVFSNKTEPVFLGADNKIFYYDHINCKLSNFNQLCGQLYLEKDV